MDLTTYVLEPEIVRLVPERIERQFKLVPLFKIGNMLTIAMVDPLDIVALDEVKLATAWRWKWWSLRSRTSAKRWIATIRSEAAGAPRPRAGREADRHGEDAVVRAEEDGPVIRFVNAVVHQAVREGASDLHFEPDESNLRIRYPRGRDPARGVGPVEVDPRLGRLAREDHGAAGHRRAPLATGWARADRDLGEGIRPARLHVPTIHGENVCCGCWTRRARSSAPPSWIGAGASPGPGPDGGEAERYRARDGPTGSGKTTTLYSCIGRINTVERNIVTLEDPVEYHLPSIRQTQVDPDVGLTFARGLRALLRQDPDVIMVGRSVTARPPRSRCAPRSPDTSCSRRSIRTTPPEPCPVSST